MMRQTAEEAVMANPRGYSSQKITRARRLVIDYFGESSTSHSVKGLIEIDLTEARSMLRRLRRENGSAPSLSAYLIHAFAHCLDPHRELQAHIKRGRRLIIFDDVDVNTVVLREVQGQTVPTIHIIRGANRKSLEEIHREISEAQSSDGSLITSEKGSSAAVLILERLPGFLRRMVIRRILRRDPEAKRKLFGTVSFSSIPMFGRGFGYGIPITPHPVHLMIGGIEKREVLRKGEAVRREIAAVTLTLNHDVADGAPAARFVTLLRGTIEAGEIAP
jgi:pyruvate/2-oxoglutarate dehydrogenase complex dihydrolipoamide acyltransferase (E2) component